MDSIDLVAEVTEEITALNTAAARWASEHDRAAVSPAIEHTDRSLVLLHRVRDAFTREAREWDERHRPYDPRD